MRSVFELASETDRLATPTGTALGSECTIVTPSCLKYGRRVPTSNVAVPVSSTERPHHPGLGRAKSGSAIKRRYSCHQTGTTYYCPGLEKSIELTMVNGCLVRRGLK
jgi:hypothetical protein